MSKVGPSYLPCCKGVISSLKPAVSVIMPAYNAESVLRQAVDSVIGQTFAGWELLLIDDGSTDGTLRLARSLAKADPRIRVFSNKGNQGVAKTRNKGLSLAQGDLIAFLDADDVWLPEKLALQIAFMEQTGCDISYTAYTLMNRVDGGTGKTYHVPPDLTLRRLLQENVIGCSTAMLRKTAAVCVQMREEYAHEDYVFWLELLQKGCTAKGIDIPLMRYRVSPAGRSFDKKRAAAERFRIYREFMGFSFVRASALWVRYSLNGLKKYYLS